VGENVATPLWGKCEDETHIPKSGNLESFRTPKNLELQCKGQNTSHWGFLHTIGKVLKCRCLKWPRMSHLDICNTSYGRKKGRESNWQFNSWPLKVGNWPDSGVCRWSVTHHLKALKERYNFAFDLIPIRDLSWELWAPKLWGVQTGTVSRLFFGSLGTKKPFGCRSHGQMQRILYGERRWLPPNPSRGESSKSMLPMACPNTKVDPKWKLTNLWLVFYAGPSS
jgi:hypothetical protein